MARKRKLEERENHERWLVSYADFITLLLALFVVMYAVSQVNEGKYQRMAGSLVNAFGAQSDRSVLITPESAPSSPVQESPTEEDRSIKKARRLAEAQRGQQEAMEVIARDVVAAFQPFRSLIENGQVRVIPSSRGLAVEINAKVLFAPGQAVLEQNSARVLEAVAQVLKNNDYPIQVEGHTDSIPIVTDKFPSNWELSAVRASSVVRLLIGSGVEAARLTAVGYGENRPVDSNDTEDGRTRNRRVTIMILSNSDRNPSDNLEDAPQETESASTASERTACLFRREKLA
ncbi:chemotaxis protein MotB [Nitrosospira multiformis ATCC 25196]|uniref:Chemotaxis protein MotB n=1 Tax=Nitrosospira multiformis (strain ATCC 25196 / NCIMB 11849 / C 71) TaxID=323848 RepID=Q2Y9F3_NITMU|nr:flagellar motor protein MotD [Nitrosospira multiformis]ABB74618.1 OmpA/MotB [Nitrosospira multiformis ATCC 25196]SEG16067.1 chemotaxis protein MotB [Nitrosospira multiformis ATCC 25196]